MFAIVDEWSEDLEKYDEEQVNSMFDALEGIAHYPEGMEAAEVFELFWNSANRNWW